MTLLVRWYIMLHAFALTALLTNSVARPARPLHSASAQPPNVTQIEILSTWAGLGSNTPYYLKLKNYDGTLTDGRYVARSSFVSDLLHALVAAPVNHPEPARIFPSYIDDAERISETLRNCVGDAADLPAVSHFFASIFERLDKKTQWAKEYYSGKYFHTDDYPALNVAVTLRDGSTIRAWSNSQTELMLPFTISRGGRTFKTFDAALPRSIARIIAGNVNSRRLNGDAIFDRYGEWLCGPEVDNEVIKTYVPDLWSTIREGQWSRANDRSDMKLSNDLGSFYGEVRQATWPQGVSFAIAADGAPLDSQSVAKAGKRELLRAHEVVRSLLSLPWMQQWSRRTTEPDVVLQRLSDRPYVTDSDEILSFLKRHAPMLFAEVAAARSDVVYLRLADKAHNSYSGWILLPDGRTILTDFSNKSSTLGPLEGHTIRSWSSFAAQENDPTFEFRYTAVVIDPNGRVIFTP